MVLMKSAERPQRLTIDARVSQSAFGAECAAVTAETSSCGSPSGDVWCGRSDLNCGAWCLRGLKG